MFIGPIPRSPSRGGSGSFDDWRRNPAGVPDLLSADEQGTGDAHSPVTDAMTAIIAALRYNPGESYSSPAVIMTTIRGTRNF